MVDVTNPVLEAIQAELSVIEADWVRLDRRRRVLHEMEMLAVSLDAPSLAPGKETPLPPEPPPEEDPCATHGHDYALPDGACSRCGDDGPPDVDPGDESIDVPVTRKEPDPAEEAEVLEKLTAPAPPVAPMTDEPAPNRRGYPHEDVEERILALLADGELNQSQIVDALGINKSTISEACQRLARADKITLARKPEGKFGAKTWKLPGAAHEPKVPAPEPKWSGLPKDVAQAHVETILEMLAEGPVLQQDITRDTGWNSGRTSRAIAYLEAAGQIVCVGKGGYLGKSKQWALPGAKPKDSPSSTPTPPPPPRAQLSPRVRKALEEEERAKRSNKPTQPPTLAGRILAALVLGEADTRMLAARLSVPQPTVERILTVLREDGDVSLSEGGKWRRVL